MIGVKSKPIIVSNNDFVELEEWVSELSLIALFYGADYNKKYLHTDPIFYRR